MAPSSYLFGVLGNLGPDLDLNKTSFLAFLTTYPLNYEGNDRVFILRSLRSFTQRLLECIIDRLTSTGEFRVLR